MKPKFLINFTQNNLSRHSDGEYAPVSPKEMWGWGSKIGKKVTYYLNGPLNRDRDIQV